MVMYTSFVNSGILKLDYENTPGAQEVTDDILSAPIDHDSDNFFRRKHRYVVDDKTIELGCCLGEKSYNNVVAAVKPYGFTETKHNMFSVPEEMKPSQED